MEQKFNIFNQAEMPSIMLCTPNLTKVHAIDSLIFGTKVILRYNAISEFNFSIPQSIDGNQTTLFVYDLIKTKKYLHIADVGYFIVQEVEENDEGLVKIKEVKCESLESELKNKKITGFERISVPLTDAFINVVYEYNAVYTSGGSVLYYEPVYYSGTTNQVILSYEYGTGLLDDLENIYISNWTRDVTKPIPESVITYGGSGGNTPIATIVRGFKISDSNVYSFLVNEVEKAYGCAILFSKEERKFYIEDINSIERTNIFISYDNLMKASSVREYSEGISTSLSCYGDKNLSINYVNPTGGSKIYNFDYFKTLEWMPQNLIDKVDEWNLAVSKELTGATTGSHIGEAWGNPNTTYYFEDARYLSVLYDVYTGFSPEYYEQLGLGYAYLYPISRRQREIAGLKRLMETMTQSVDDVKIIKTHINFLFSTLSTTTAPTDTDTYYYQQIYETLPMTDSLQVIEEDITFSSARQIRVRIENNYSFSFNSTVTILGFDGSNAPLEVDVTLDSNNAFSGGVTDEYFKKITSVYVPNYSHPEDTFIIEYKEVLTSIPIPAGKQLVLTDYYQWSTKLGYLKMKYLGVENFLYNYYVRTAKNCVTALKTLESGEKYSNLVEYLFKAYEMKYSIDLKKTFVENLIEEQEILMAAAIELKDNDKKSDHMVNIKFLNEFRLLGEDSTPIPSTTNVTYTLNDDDNKLNEQSMVDMYLTKGTTTDGETVDYYNGYGGLDCLKARYLAVNRLIHDIQDIMDYITGELEIRSFFSGFYSWISPFIIESTYQNEYLVNYSGEIKDKIKTSVELYNQSVEVLERTSSPRYEFSIDSINFINLYEYKDTFTKELSLGKKVTINLKEGSLLEVILLELEYSFDDLENINMTFGNRLRLDDVRFQYTDFIGQIYKVGSDVSFDKNEWSDFSTDYKGSLDVVLNNPTDEVNNNSLVDLDSTKVEDQTFEITVTKAGILVRKRLDEGNYSPKKILLTNGVIAYTTDDWSTISYVNNP